MKTPWQMAEVGNEFSHQTALFAWAAMAQNFGPLAANDPLSYSVENYVRGYGPTGNMPIPELQWLHAIKNAGHGDAIRGARAAAEGVKPGVPDMFLPVPIKRNGPYGENYPYRHGLYIELKRPISKSRAKGYASDANQVKWQQYLSSAGYAVDVCYGWEAARDAILKYLGR